MVASGGSSTNKECWYFHCTSSKTAELVEVLVGGLVGGTFDLGSYSGYSRSSRFPTHHHHVKCPNVCCLWHLILPHNMLFNCVSLGQSRPPSPQPGPTPPGLQISCSCLIQQLWTPQVTCLFSPHRSMLSSFSSKWKRSLSWTPRPTFPERYQSFSGLCLLMDYICV